MPTLEMYFIMLSYVNDWSVSFLTTCGLSNKTDCCIQEELIEVSKYEKHAASVYNISKRDRK